MPELTLRPLHDTDEALVEGWLALPHVRPWFRHPEDWMHEIRERRGEFSFLHHLIAEREGQRIGFCQYYACTEDELPWSAALPHAGSWSIDYLLGDAALLGQRLGRDMVAALCRRVFAQDGARRIVVRPDPGNTPSRRTLLSCGFALWEGDLFVLTRERWRKGN